MTRTQRVARATAGRPYSAHRAYPQLVGWALPTNALLQHHRFLTLIPPKRSDNTRSNIAIKRWIRPITDASNIYKWWAMPTLPGYPKRRHSATLI